MTRGGLRANIGGRPQEAPTKVIRVPETEVERIKSGYYEALEALIKDWKMRQADSTHPNSRDWTRMAEFLSEYEEMKSNHLKS